jgi:uncharacterized cupredoxin-like copper-binding protein
MSTRRRLRAVSLAVAMLALAAAGCGDELTERVVMTEFGYEPEEIRVPAGAAHELLVANEGQLFHDLAVDGTPEGAPVHIGVLPGGRAPYVVPALPAGVYEVYCSVPGHREAGMLARLVVVPQGGD